MSFTTNETRLRLLNQDLNLATATLACMLVSANYVPDKDHVYVSAITGGVSSELNGTGYVAGFGGGSRIGLSSPAFVKDDGTDEVKFYADDIVFTALNCGTIRYVVIYEHLTSDADSYIVAVLDINPTAGYTTDGNDFQMVASNGILLSRAA